MTTVRIAGIIRESIVDGPGIRFVVFTQGCPHHCEGCHNPESHDPNGGYDCDIEKIVHEVQKDPLLSGVTFSGGEPMMQPAPLLKLAEKLRLMGKNLIIFSGFTAEQLLEMGQTNPDILKLLSLTDVLIDGKFELAKRNLNLRFRGSENQRIIDAKATVKAGKAVETTI